MCQHCISSTFFKPDSTEKSLSHASVWPQVLVSEFLHQPQSSHLENGNISAQTQQVKARHSCSLGGRACSVQMQNTMPSKQGGRRGDQAASDLTNLIIDWLNPPHPQPRVPKGSVSHPAWGQPNLLHCWV